MTDTITVTVVKQWCAILDIQLSSASDETAIKKAFKKKSLKGEYCHPDKGGSKANFQALNAAKDGLLSDPTLVRHARQENMRNTTAAAAAEERQEHNFGRHGNGRSNTSSSSSNNNNNVRDTDTDMDWEYTPDQASNDQQARHQDYIRRRKAFHQEQALRRAANAAAAAAFAQQQEELRREEEEALRREEKERREEATRNLARQYQQFAAQQQQIHAQQQQYYPDSRDDDLDDLEQYTEEAPEANDDENNNTPYNQTGRCNINFQKLWRAICLLLFFVCLLSHMEVPLPKIGMAVGVTGAVCGLNLITN